MKNITIYSTPTCGYCDMAKEFLKQNNVAYTDYDVTEDMEKQKEMIEKSGQMGVPVISLQSEGEEEVIMVGFDRSRLSEVLGLNK
jgi:glutaredoxin 3